MKSKDIKTWNEQISKIMEFFFYVGGPLFVIR